MRTYQNCPIYPNANLYDVPIFGEGKAQTVWNKKAHLFFTLQTVLQVYS